jgi:capsule synthesis protein PGA_cap
VPRRLALISVTSSSLPEARATATRADVRGRPGVNPLRYAADITVDAGTFQTLRNSIATLNAGPPAGADELTMFGTPIRKGDRTAVSFTVDENDERDILDAIKTARLSAEAVIVSFHSHEPANASDAPAEFAQRFARRAIDAGATLVVGHGPHRLRGVEVYNGGVILYSLGNLIYQTAGLDFRAANVYDAGADLYRAAIGALGVGPQNRAGPPDGPTWWEGAIALATINGGRLESLRLVPVDLGGDKPSEGKGIPRIASGDRATAILRRLSGLSDAYGTAIQIEAGTGLVRGNSPKQ